jgi:hypothetical protein
MKPSNLDLSFLALAAALVLGLGCQSPVKEHWGESVNGNKAAMIQNPDAGNTVEAVEGLDPVTGKLVVERYQREQLKEAEEHRELFLIAD